MKIKPQDSSPASQLQWQHFGALLRERRNAAKLSRVDLARQAKVSDATIKFIETARHRPSRATLICLLAVADLNLTWAEVPGLHESPAENKDIPAAPLHSSPPASVQNKGKPAAPFPTAPPPPEEPSPDPAQFLMDLIGFDEIRLPLGTPKTLRIFQERHRVAGLAGGKNRADGREGA